MKRINNKNFSIVSRLKNSSDIKHKKKILTILLSKFFYITIGILLFLVSYNFDQQVILFFKDVNFIYFDIILSVITNFWVVIAIILLIPSIILYKKNMRLVYLLWLTFIASFIFAFIIKLIIARQRPIEQFTYPFINIIDYSFPSMHSMIVFALLPLLIKYSPKEFPLWRKFFWIFTFLVAFSRIYFRVHFLSDVVFGALAGYFIGVTCRKYLAS